MYRGLILKEWLKTRWALLALLLIGIGATAYDLITLQRVMTLKGVSHLWELLLTKDVILISAIKYQPLLTGIVIAVTQFVPEMTQKRLKLTLHLPLQGRNITATMLAYGVVASLIIYLLQIVMIYSYTSQHMAPELVSHLLVTLAPWLLAGLASYGLTALIVLEPTWRLRVVYILIAYGVVQLFYVINTPRAYQDMLLPLFVVAVVLCFSAFLSVGRFKDGIQ